MFISEVELIREEMLENEVVIEGEFATVATMETWGFSEHPFCEAVLCETSFEVTA